MLRNLWKFLRDRTVAWSYLLETLGQLLPCPGVHIALCNVQCLDALHTVRSALCLHSSPASAPPLHIGAPVHRIGICPQDMRTKLKEVKTENHNQRQYELQSGHY